tara:strand:- start:1138 stop:2697 length:1560 start_codon:yes stop_codon:yes gene_type:complete
MSYRDPKIIDNKSALLVPQALMKGVADISSAFNDKIGAQQKANALEAKRLTNLGFRIDESEQNSLEDLGKVKLAGSEAYQQSVRDAQSHFNQMYFDAKRDVYTNRSLTNKQTAELRDKMTFAKGQLNKINAHIPRVATVSANSKELRENGNTILGHTKSYKAIDSYTKDDSVGMGSAIDNMKGTSLLMSYDDKGNLFLNGTYGDNGSMTQSLESFNDENWSLTEDINQVVEGATAGAAKNIMNGNAVDPSYFSTAGVDAQGNPTQLPLVIEEKVKIMEGDAWTGDYQVTSYGRMNEKGSGSVLGAVQLATADLTALQGQSNYLATMRNQFNIDDKTSNLWKAGDKNAEKVVNSLINQEVAGRFGLLAKPKLDAERQIIGYDFVKPGKTTVDKAPGKSMTQAKSLVLLNNYMEDLDIAAENNVSRDELIAQALQIGPNRRIRIKQGYYTPVGMEINDGLVTITKTGKPDKESKDASKDSDIVYYDLNDSTGLYNFIRATTPMQDTEVRALRKKILAYQSN